MSRKCPNCSADVLDNAKFCIKCGTKMPLDVSSGSSPAPTEGRAPQLTPTPFANRVPPPASTNANSSGVTTVFASPITPTEPKKEAASSAEAPASQTSAIENAIKTDPIKGGSNKGIIFGGIGVLIAAIGGFLLTSGKDEPAKSVNAPAMTAPATPAPAPTTATPPPRPAAPVAPPPAVVPAPIAPKPASPPPPPQAVPAPAPVPAPAVPDVNKLMRDAANK